MNIALIGPSGSGKGTQAKRLLERLSLEYLGAGELLRESVEKKTPSGLIAQRYLHAGELVPDDVVDELIAERIRAKQPGGLLLDGFPRTPTQAAVLEDLLKNQGERLDAVILLQLECSISVERLSGRTLCASCGAIYHLRLNPPKKDGVCDACGGGLVCRCEDSPLMAAARWRVFQRGVLALLRHYQPSGRLYLIDGSQPSAPIEQAISALLAEIQSGTAASVTSDEIEHLNLAAPVQVNLAENRSPAALDIVLLGAPGSGKGTLAAKLQTHLHSSHIACGELFRQNVDQGTELGRLAKACMNRGELVPDDVTDAMIEDRLSRADGKGFILDGFPRTLPQAEALDHILGRLSRPLSAVLHIRAPDACLIERLAGRWICRKCQAPYHQVFHPPQHEGRCDKCGGPLYQREDDKHDTIRTRLRTYHKQTEPLLEFYSKAGALVQIDGEGDVDTVSIRALEAVESIKDYLCRA